MASNTQSNSPKRDYIYLIVALGLTVAVVIGTIVLLTREPETVSVEIRPPFPTVTHTPEASYTPSYTPRPTDTPGPLEIYVTGAVYNPEMRLQLSYGSRVEDAITAAGGPLPDANLQAVNMAARLQDGDQIHVPFLSPTAESADTLSPEPVLTATSSIPRLININEATQAELETLPRIGPARAADIIAYRETNGPFESIEELLEISGIGDATLEQLRSLITLD